MTLKKEVGRYILYNVLTIPIIIAIYAPYMLVWIGLTPEQFFRWVVAALPFALVANIVIAPLFRRVYGLIDRIIA